jgi:hypothetical protein
VAGGQAETAVRPPGGFQCGVEFHPEAGGIGCGGRAGACPLEHAGQAEEFREREHRVS